MSETHASIIDANGPGTYEIRLKGHLDKRWSDSLEGLTFTQEAEGITTLSGSLVDQAALHGVLNRIRDLGIPIISIQRIGSCHKAAGEQLS